jgi:hypothetical protein
MRNIQMKISLGKNKNRLDTTQKRRNEFEDRKKETEGKTSIAFVTSETVSSSLALMKLKDERRKQKLFEEIMNNFPQNFDENYNSIYPNGSH